MSLYVNVFRCQELKICVLFTLFGLSQQLPFSAQIGGKQFLGDDGKDRVDLLKVSSFGLALE